MNNHEAEHARWEMAGYAPVLDLLSGEAVYGCSECRDTLDRQGRPTRAERRRLEREHTGNRENPNEHDAEGYFNVQKDNRGQNRIAND